MAATMTSYSTEILVTKGILQILHLKHRGFTSVFVEKFYEKMVTLIQSRSLELF